MTPAVGSWLLPLTYADQHTPSTSPPRWPAQQYRAAQLFGWDCAVIDLGASHHPHTRIPIPKLPTPPLPLLLDARWLPYQQLEAACTRFPPVGVLTSDQQRRTMTRLHHRLPRWRRYRHWHTDPRPPKQSTRAYVLPYDVLGSPYQPAWEALLHRLCSRSDLLLLVDRPPSGVLQTTFWRLPVTVRWVQELLREAHRFTLPDKVLPRIGAPHPAFQSSSTVLHRGHLSQKIDALPRKAESPKSSPVSALAPEKRGSWRAGHFICED